MKRVDQAINQLLSEIDAIVTDDVRLVMKHGLLILDQMHNIQKDYLSQTHLCSIFTWLNKY